jgi:hypothetical protein
MKKSLKSDRTLILTSILLFFMLTAGIISGVLGFISGHTALKGVTQPDIRPNNNKSGSNVGSKNLEMLQERELIVNVKKKMGIDEPKKDVQQVKDAKKQSEAFEKAVKNDPKAGVPVAQLPIVREDQGIVMAVKTISTQGNNVKLELTLVNQGSQSVNFGQSTINVTNDSSSDEKKNQRAQGISATTLGLPTNLPANGKEVKITLSIPKSSLDKVKMISLQLTDADKKLQLEASGIPVGK